MSATRAEEADFRDDALDEEIADLEARLAHAKERLRLRNNGRSQDESTQPQRLMSPTGSALPSTTHFLLLLSDSALPLGSFAFSSGLESYLAHATAAARTSNSNTQIRHQPPSFSAFLPISIASYASTTLPFVLAAHQRFSNINIGNDPSENDELDENASAAANYLAYLDDMLDATVICTVARRASVAQGRALLSVWERSFAAPSSALPSPAAAAAALRPFSALLKGTPTATTTSLGGETLPAVSAHLGPLFGAVAGLVGLGQQQTGYVFVLAHVKALVSAAVRAGLFGPYQAQRLLAGAQVQALVDAAVRRAWDTPPEEAGQTVPVMDLWVGRHEVLYSRIFNS